MGKNAWSRPGGAVAVLARVRLEPQAAALLAAEHSPADFVARLAEEGHAVDAVRFAAFALPRRAAVGWACLCVRQTLPPGATGPAPAALAAAQRWVGAPTEANRRAALLAAEDAEFGTAAGCCAAAAFWSGGSLAPQGLTPVPPPEHLLPGAVAAAVLLAAVAGAPGEMDRRLRRFLALAAAGTRSVRPRPPPTGAGPARACPTAVAFRPGAWYAQPMSCRLLT